MTAIFLGGKKKHVFSQQLSSQHRVPESVFSAAEMTRLKTFAVLALGFALVQRCHRMTHVFPALLSINAFARYRIQQSGSQIL